MNKQPEMFEKWWSNYSKNRHISGEPDASSAAESAWQAAIASQQDVPLGWKLVPIVPTEKMVNEGSCAQSLPGPHYIESRAARKCWEYMIEAAPEPNK